MDGCGGFKKLGWFSITGNFRGCTRCGELPSFLHCPSPKRSVGTKWVQVGRSDEEAGAGDSEKNFLQFFWRSLIQRPLCWILDKRRAWAIWGCQEGSHKVAVSLQLQPNLMPDTGTTDRRAQSIRGKSDSDTCPSPEHRKRWNCPGAPTCWPPTPSLP